MTLTSMIRQKNCVLEAYNVTVANDETLAVESLGCREVGLLRVGEDTSLEVGDVQLGVKGRVGSNAAAVLGEQELGGRHLVGRGDQADRGGVA